MESFDKHLRSIRNAAEVERRGIVAARKLFIESADRRAAEEGVSPDAISFDDPLGHMSRKERRAPLYHDTVIGTTKLGAMFDLQHRPSTYLGKQPIVRKKTFGGRRIAVIVEPDTGLEYTLHATRGWKVTGRYDVATNLQAVAS